MTQRTSSYRDFMPNRYRDFVPPPRLPALPGAVIITSTGTFVVNARGEQEPRPPRV